MKLIIAVFLGIILVYSWKSLLVNSVRSLTRNKVNGIEGLPLKYLAMLLMSILVVAAFIHITNMLATTGLQGVRQSNQTLNEVLNKSIGDILQQNTSSG